MRALWAHLWRGGLFLALGGVSGCAQPTPTPTPTVHSVTFAWQQNSQNALVPLCTVAAPPCLTSYTLTDANGNLLATINIGDLSYTLTPATSGVNTYNLYVNGTSVAGGVVVSTPAVVTVTVPN